MIGYIIVIVILALVILGLIISLIAMVNKRKKKLTNDNENGDYPNSIYFRPI